MDIPDELLSRAESRAAERGISLARFFIEAIQARLVSEKPKVRRMPPVIGDANAALLPALSREQIDEAMFG